MAESPTLSVCIPNYNMARWVAEAVDSALCVHPQALVEIVVGDNASTDRSLAELARFRHVESVRILEFDKHVPMAQSFDRVVANSRGAWCVLLSADDSLEPAFLTNLLPEANSGFGAISQWARLRTREESERYGDQARREYRPEASPTPFAVGNPFCLSTTAFRRDAFERIGGFALEGEGELCDWGFWFKMIYRTRFTVLATGACGGSYFLDRGGVWSGIVDSGEGPTRYYLGLDRAMTRERALGNLSAIQERSARVGIANALLRRHGKVSINDPAWVVRQKNLELASSLGAGPARLFAAFSLRVSRLPWVIALPAYTLIVLPIRVAGRARRWLYGRLR